MTPGCGTRGRGREGFFVCVGRGISMAYPVIRTVPTAIVRFFVRVERVRCV